MPTPLLPKTKITFLGNLDFLTLFSGSSVLLLTRMNGAVSAVVALVGSDGRMNEDPTTVEVGSGQDRAKTGNWQ